MATPGKYGAATPATLLGQWPVPTSGINRELPPHQLPLEYCAAGWNVVIREGAITTRDYLLEQSSTVFTGTPNGGFEYLTTAGARIPLAFMTTRVYKYDGGSWSDITGTALSGSQDAPTQAAILAVSGTNTVMLVNGTDKRQWANSGNTSTVSGSPPNFTDIEQVGRRIIGIVPPYEIRWGNADSLATWPAANSKFASETPDALTAIGPLGTLGCVLHKEDSLWIGYASAGADSQAFRFEPAKLVPGAAGPAARCHADGVEYYMTSDGRIGAFDGHDHAWVSDGLWTLIRKSIDKTKTKRVTAVYYRDRGEVWFTYTQTGDATTNRYLAILSLPRPLAGIPGYATFGGWWGSPGPSPISVGAMFQTKSSGVWQVWALRTDSGSTKCYTLTDPGGGTVADAGVAFSCTLTLALQPTPGLQFFQADSLETFAYRYPGLGTAIVDLLGSSDLQTPDNNSPALPADQTIDLTTAPTQELLGWASNHRRRWFSPSYRWTSNTGRLRFYGALLHGHPIGAP
jgi:hypothetical protein